MYLYFPNSNVVLGYNKLTNIFLKLCLVNELLNENEDDYNKWRIRDENIYFENIFFNKWEYKNNKIWLRASGILLTFPIMATLTYNKNNILFMELNDNEHLDTNVEFVESVNTIWYFLK
jgi:hypothetical protein